MKAFNSIGQALKSLTQELDSVSEDLQSVQSRDLIKAMRWKRIIPDKHNFRWEIVDREFQKNNAVVNSVIRHENALTHGFNPKVVYESLMNFKTVDAICEGLQLTHANHQSLSKLDFVTLMTGVPVPLIQHALSKFRSCGLFHH